MLRYVLRVISGFLFLVNSAIAQSTLIFDSSFATNGVFIENFGFHDNLVDIKIQPDQKLICTGTALSTSYTGTLKVMRLDTNGTPDPAFAANGVFSYSITNETYGVESFVRSDGKILVAGMASVTNGYYDFLLLQLKQNGTLDSTFGNNGSIVYSYSSRDDLTQAMTVQPDGKIIVSGTVNDNIDYFNNPCIIRFTQNGQIDSAFAGNGIFIYPALHFDNELNSVIVQPDGKITAAGHYSPVFTGATNFDILLIRVDSSGMPDSTFGVNGIVITPVNGGIDDCFGMKQDTAGHLILCGFTTQPFTLDIDMLLMKYNQNGVPDTTFANSGMVIFNNDVEDVAYDLLIQSDNKIVVCGGSGKSFSNPRAFALWRFNPDGTPDATFGVNGFDTSSVTPTFQDFHSVTMQADGKLVATGKFQNVINNNNDVTVIRFKEQVLTSTAGHDANRWNFFPNPVSRNQWMSVVFDKHNQSCRSVFLIDNAGKQTTLDYRIGMDNRLYCQIPGNVKSGVYFMIVECSNFRFHKKLVVF